MKIYLVTFDTYKDKIHYEYVFHCYAPNAKEAVKMARESWRRNSYQFHLHATRSRIQDSTLLQCRSHMGKVFSGDYLIGQHICTHSNLYKRNTAI